MFDWVYSVAFDACVIYVDSMQMYMYDNDYKKSCCYLMCGSVLPRLSIITRNDNGKICQSASIFNLFFVPFHCMLFHSSVVVAQVCWAEHEMPRCWLPLLTPTCYSSSSSRVPQRHLQVRTRRRPLQPPQQWWCFHRRLLYLFPFLCRRLPAMRRHCPASALRPASTSAFGRTSTPRTLIGTPAMAADLSRRWPMADDGL